MFLKNYGKIASPLTLLLKKNSFFWNEATEQAFSALKYSMFTTLVLAVPHFTKTFVQECDAYGRGLDIVLMQEGKPIEFTSK